MYATQSPQLPYSPIPFPHLMIDRLLPAAAFDVLLEAIPPEEFFDGEDPRHRDLKGPARSPLPPFSKAIWSSLSRDVVAGVLGPALAERFRPFAADSLGVSVGEEFVDEALALPLETRGLRIMLRRPGWELPPHLDPRDQFMTTLLYLARPDEPEQYGTQLFRVHREHFVATWAKHLLSRGRRATLRACKETSVPRQRLPVLPQPWRWGARCRAARRRATGRSEAIRVPVLHGARTAAPKSAHQPSVTREADRLDAPYEVKGSQEAPAGLMMQRASAEYSSTSPFFRESANGV